MAKRKSKMLRVCLTLLLFALAFETPFYGGQVVYTFSGARVTGDKQPEIYTRPCYELFGSFTSGRRYRTDETGDTCRAVWCTFSRMDRKMIKEATETLKIARHHAWKTYQERSINEMTAGGKNTIKIVGNIEDWQEELRQSYPA